jgi:dethiobiotin synthetase
LKILFISGTDTGVGKTLASALLCRDLLSRGLRVGYYKPVQTGAEEVNGTFLSVDTEFVKSICSDALQVTEPLMLKLPASPHLAAQCENVAIDIEEIVQKAISTQGLDYLIVEGAGGLAVPFNNDCDMAGLCKKLEAELVIVTRANLGTLNHTFLSVDYAETFELKPWLIISGCHQDADIIERDNLMMLSEKCEGRIMGKIPQIADLDTEDFKGLDLPAVKFKV